MPLVTFTTNLQRHVSIEPTDAPGSTVREALDHVFAANPKARGYILDERGGVRTHMTIFVDGAPVRDREHLSDPVSPDADIYVMQALSGG